MTQANQELHELAKKEYQHGFVTDIEADTLPPGLDENTVRAISARKNEPEWMLQWRLEAFAKWQQMKPPTWPYLHVPEIDFQSISYYSAPKRPEDGPKSLDEVDPKLLETYDKLGIPLEEQKLLAGVQDVA